jgi:hypothetical protein
MADMKSNYPGCGLFSTLLFVLFLGLKLAGIGAVASWSWWWVTSPLWIPAAGVLLVLAAYLCLLIVKIIKGK